MIDKKFLKELGITDDAVVTRITGTYSADIQAEKDAAAALQTQLTEANTTIQSFKDMDIEGIQKSADEWKQKAETAEAERQAFEHRTKLQAYVKGLHLRDDIYEAHVTKLLEDKGLKFDGDKLIGGEDVVQTFRESHADAFAPDKSEQAAGPTSGNAPETMSGVEKRFYERNPHLTPKN